MDEHKQDGNVFMVYLKFNDEERFREYLVRHCPDSVNFQRNEKCPWPLIFDFDIAKDVVRPCIGKPGPQERVSLQNSAELYRIRPNSAESGGILPNSAESAGKPVPAVRVSQCIMCDICWTALVRPNLIKLYKFLTEVMEFRRVLVFYTGGRGFHIYVFDEKTRDYDDVTRYNIFYKSPVNLDKEVFIKMSHQIRVPFSPHQDTGWVSRPVDDVDGFLPSMCKKFWEVTQKDVEEWVEKCMK